MPTPLPTVHEMLNLLWFLLIGIASGWLAGQLWKGRGFGLAGNMVIGVLGAVVGGFVFRMLGLSTSNSCGTLITATVGALILLFAVQRIDGRRRR